jgi:hypothetical protein
MQLNNFISPVQPYAISDTRVEPVVTRPWDSPGATSNETIAEAARQARLEIEHSPGEHCTILLETYQELEVLASSTIAACLVGDIPFAEARRMRMNVKRALTQANYSLFAHSAGRQFDDEVLLAVCLTNLDSNPWSKDRLRQIRKRGQEAVQRLERIIIPELVLSSGLKHDHLIMRLLRTDDELIAMRIKGLPDSAQSSPGPANARSFSAPSTAQKPPASSVHAKNMRIIGAVLIGLLVLITVANALIYLQ